MDLWSYEGEQSKRLPHSNSFHGYTDLTKSIDDPLFPAYCPSTQRFVQIHNQGLSSSTSKNIERKKQPFVLHNTIDTVMAVDDVFLIEYQRLKCPRCKKIAEQARKTSKKHTIIDINNIRGICDHCKTNEPSKVCQDCTKALRKYLAQKKIYPGEYVPVVESWLSKTERKIKQTGHSGLHAEADLKLVLEEITNNRSTFSAILLKDQEQSAKELTGEEIKKPKINKQRNRGKEYEDKDFKFVFPTKLVKEPQPQISSSELIEKTRKTLYKEAGKERNINEKKHKRNEILDNLDKKLVHKVGERDNFFPGKFDDETDKSREEKKTKIEESNKERENASRSRKTENNEAIIKLKDDKNIKKTTEKLTRPKKSENYKEIINSKDDKFVNNQPETEKKKTFEAEKKTIPKVENKKTTEADRKKSTVGEAKKTVLKAENKKYTEAIKSKDDKLVIKQPETEKKKSFEAEKKIITKAEIKKNTEADRKKSIEGEARHKVTKEETFSPTLNKDKAIVKSVSDTKLHVSKINSKNISKESKPEPSDGKKIRAKSDTTAVLDKQKDTNKTNDDELKNTKAEQLGLQEENKKASKATKDEKNKMDEVKMKGRPIEPSESKNITTNVVEQNETSNTKRTKTQDLSNVQQNHQEPIQQKTTQAELLQLQRERETASKARQVEREMEKQDVNMKSIKVNEKDPGQKIIEMKGNLDNKKTAPLSNTTPILLEKKHIKSSDSDDTDDENYYTTTVRNIDPVTEIILKQRIINIDVARQQRPVQEDKKPILFKTIVKIDGNPEPATETTNELCQKASKTYKTLPEEESHKGVIKYALSDKSYIDKGWTVLPIQAVVRKMNVYRMRPARPEFDWFEHNKHKGLMLYDSGERLAEFNEKGRGRWFYRNGNLALEYYDAEEANANQRIIVYSSGEPDERGRSRAPMTILATFDYNGNGIVFDHGGKIRLKYNQTEGVVLDKSLGPVSNWKWHSLNDPPVLQQVMIDTLLPSKDARITKLGHDKPPLPSPDNEAMRAIEYDNLLKEKNKKISEVKYKPFQIKMKALKINENFSLRVHDQASVHLLFRDGTTNMKLNLGMILDDQEIIDTDMTEVGKVTTSVEKTPAQTESVAALQMRVTQAQRAEHAWEAHCRFLQPPLPPAPPLPPLPHRNQALCCSQPYGRARRSCTTQVYYDNRLM